MNGYLLIAVFTYQYEYLIIQGILEDAGIRFLKKNETLAGLLPFYSNALGGIHLLVHQEDFNRAKKIIEDFQNTNPHLKVV
ncbi:putative signal transducing protein [Salegentibacter sp.]|uniref:putative signal transducing protein n=1 Tax=Salegentibacter sp. TaxID=1903072 RepID=UPI00356779F6